MSQAPRKRTARYPRFPLIQDLRFGDPFRPYKLFELYSVRGAILKSRKLKPGAKVVWVMLADECHSSGFDRQTQAHLAEKAGMSLTQFRHHLGRLVKLKLVHVEHELGRQNFTWLLYHSVFAYCSPLTPSETRGGGPRKPEEGVLGNPSTQRNYQRNYQRSGGVTLDNATSYRGAVPSDGRREGEARWAPDTMPAGTDNGEIVDSVSPSPGLAEYTRASVAGTSESLVPRRDARSFWFSLSPIEKRNRLERASSVHERVIYFRQFLKDSHADIQNQARHEIERALAELGSMGFTLHTNGKGKT